MCGFCKSDFELEYCCYYERDTKVYQLLDSIFRKFIIEQNGIEFSIPSLINIEVLKKCGYVTSFPHHITTAGYVKPEAYKSVFDNNSISSKDVELKNKCLTPAACLHIYPMIAENPIMYTNCAITTRARVYRYENEKFDGITRFWDFTVREFVFVGSKNYVLNKLEATKIFVNKVMRSLSIDSQILVASDYFYPSKGNNIKEKMQLANAFKNELEVLIENSKVALVSFNFHGTHFSKAFEFDNNGKVVTGCIGFGLERWMALIKNYNVSFEMLQNLKNVI